jgi:hypothetical protein
LAVYASRARIGGLLRRARSFASTLAERAGGAAYELRSLGGGGSGGAEVLQARRCFRLRQTACKVICVLRA